MPAAPELPAPVGVPETAPAASEQAPAAAEKIATQPQFATGALPAIPLSLPATPTPATPQTDVSSTTNSDVSITADDTDLIEKEWVEKAKKIVERTRDDPRQQSDELTAFKADYLQKRYGKIIKLDT